MSETETRDAAVEPTPEQWVDDFLDQPRLVQVALAERIIAESRAVTDLDDVRAEVAALRSAVEWIESLAKIQATACRAMHRADHERNWLDVLAIIERIPASVGSSGEAHVEIGGQRMTEAQYEAARRPLLDGVASAAEADRLREVWGRSDWDGSEDSMHSGPSGEAESGGTVLRVPDSPKMLRETLCVAQACINASRPMGGRRTRHVDRLQRLIDECDRHRPLGPDGKHGDRHTATCGCGDDPAPVSSGGQADGEGERCPRCGGLSGSHGLVHVRHGNGGGHNEPCPLTQATSEAPSLDDVVMPRETLAERIKADGSLFRAGYEEGEAAAAARPVLSREALRKRLDGHWPEFGNEGIERLWVVCLCGWRYDYEAHCSGRSEAWRDHLADVLTAGGEHRG